MMFLLSAYEETNKKSTLPTTTAEVIDDPNSKMKTRKEAMKIILHCIFLQVNIKSRTGKGKRNHAGGGGGDRSST